MRTTLLASMLGACGLLPTAWGAEVFLDDFETGYTPGSHLSTYWPMWFARTGTPGPSIQAGVGLAGSMGLSTAQKHFHWSGHSFTWTDADLAAVIIGLDFESANAGDPALAFDDDRIGWSITDTQEANDGDMFCVQLEAGNIAGNFRTAGSSTDRKPVIAPLPSVTPNAWYRFRAKYTKLTDTSARIDVSVQELAADGTPGAIIASGTVQDTSVTTDTWRWVPNPAYFTTAKLYPTFKNYNEKSPGNADNAYLEIIRSLPPCGSTVSPVLDQLATAEIGQAANPGAIDFSFNNVGAADLTYTVVELDANQQPADVGWLTLSKGGGLVPSQTSDPVTATIDTAGLPGGRHTAYVRFTDNCDPPAQHVRRIDLDVYACHWSVNSCSQERAYLLDYPAAIPEDVVYTITNTGASPINYTVTKSGAAAQCFDWLQLTNASGTVAAGESANVTASINPAALVGYNTDTAYLCRLTFADDCSPQTVTRDVKLRYLGVGDTQVFAYGGNVLPTNDDSAGPGMRFDLDGDSQFNGAVEEDAGAVNGYVWRLVDSTGTLTTWYRATYFNNAQQWVRVRERGEVGSTLLARIKLRSWGPEGGTRRAMLRIAETNVSSADYHWGGLDGMVLEPKRGIGVNTGQGTDDFVILRLTSIGSEGNDLDHSWDCGRTVRLYLNENPVPVVEILNADNKGTGTSGDRGLWFGDSSAAGLVDMAVDWVSGTNAGAFAPGQEEAVLGRSLIPTFEPPPPKCPIPFADADKDHDVDQLDFAVFQICFTGTSASYTDVDTCKCFDRDENGRIDSDDYAAFAACATGPSIPFDADQPPPGCNP
ncbi:MAG: hypothetical protein AMXMBFR83_10110 [Phycisphaerae bacterium]